MTSWKFLPKKWKKNSEDVGLDEVIDQRRKECGNWRDPRLFWKVRVRTEKGSENFGWSSKCFLKAIKDFFGDFFSNRALHESETIEISQCLFSLWFWKAWFSNGNTHYHPRHNTYHRDRPHEPYLKIFNLLKMYPYYVIHHRFFYLHKSISRCKVFRR